MRDIIVGRNESDREKLGMAGTILIGKTYVKMGRVTAMANEVYLDVASSHVVFIVGKRGGGKCLTGDTLITLEDGSQVKIKDLENNDKQIIALKSDLKINKAKKTEFFKRTVDRILSIRFRSGKEIELTPEHPLLTVKGWMPADKLNIGSRIATPRKLPFFGDKYIEENRVKLLAYLIAEGHLSNNFVIFSNTDNKIINDFKLAVHEFDKNLTIKKHSNDYNFRIVGNTKRTIKNAIRNNFGQFSKGSKFEKNTIIAWLENSGIYGKLAHEKTIPDLIFTITKQNTALFLNRLFSCDGSIYKRNNQWFIAYNTSSKQLAKQVHHLLLRFDIISRIRTKKTQRRDNYELIINEENTYKFLQEIGFFGEKEKRMNTALNESIKITRNPNKDTIPKEIWETYQPDNWAEIGRKLNYSVPKAMRESQKYSPSRMKLLQIAKADENELIEKLACSDIFWDEIVSIKEIEGKTEVYDISVPEHHNFVANDIIVHNSYTMGVIAEGMGDLPVEVKQNISFIFLDTMGVYWTMKYPNKQQPELLDEWGLKGKPMDVKIYTPYVYYKKFKDQGIPTDAPFSVQPSELNSGDWQMTFEINPNDPMGVLIDRVIYTLKKDKEEFSIEDIVEAVRKDDRAEQQVKDAVENRFLGTESWGVFAEAGQKGTPISELAAPGQVTILDLTPYATMPNGWKVKHLIVGIVSQKLFIQRMIARKKEEFDMVHSTMSYFSTEDVAKKQEMPLVWLIIDEAHEFLPVRGKTAATDPLVTIMREGRQPGISLILATQQPGKIHTDVMTQSDTVIAHRITAKIDTEALGALMQSYMREGLTVQLDNLPRVKGAAIIFDDSNEKMYPMRIRPRFTWHGGSAPVAVKPKKEEV